MEVRIFVPANSLILIDIHLRKHVLVHIKFEPRLLKSEGKSP